MKHFFFSVITMVSAAVSAQTTMFIGAIDNNWHNGNNWNTGLVPTGINNVIIQAGKTAIATSEVTVNSIALQDGSTINLGSNLNCNTHIMIPFGTTFIWTSGQISAQTITNNGAMNLVPFGGKQLINGTQLDNSGVITISTDWSLDIQNGTLNNLPSGVINLAAVQANIVGSGTGSHVLNNMGLLKKTVSTSTSILSAELHNSGTISSEAGDFYLQNPNIVLNGGIYNTSAGARLHWNSTLALNGAITGTNLGDIIWSGTVNVPTTASINFTGGGLFNWGNGHLGGGGTLTNLGLMQLTPAWFGTKYIDDGTTLANSGTIEISTDWALIVSNGFLNNSASGVIRFTTDGSSIDQDNSTGQHQLSNAGLITKTAGSGNSTIKAKLTNTGTITVQSGFIRLDNPQTTLNGGMYHTATGTYIEWASTVICSGTLSGTLNGSINWWGDVSIPTSAQFNFTGSGAPYWLAGNLKGGGQLLNSNTFFQGAGGNKSITGNTTLNNAGTFNITSDSGFTIENGTINNQATGIIDLKTSMQINAGTGTHVINNAGLIKRTTVGGTATIQPRIVNMGTIDLALGRIAFVNLDNTITGIVTGISEMDFPIPANFTNSGTFAPGGHPGILSGFGTYKSSANSKLDVEIFGLTQDSQYDRLNIIGNAEVAGTVIVHLNFAPVIGNQFVVLTTTSGTITTCAMTSTTAADYNGFHYVFSVGCVDDNKVVLTLMSVTLAVPENDLVSGITLAPNPAQGFISLRNQSGQNLDRLTIADVSGRIVNSFIPTNETEQQINLDDLTSGLYLIKIESKNATITKRITVR